MKKDEVFNGFTALILIACLLSVGLNLINGRFHPGDFKVYYTAAEKLITGGKVYLESFYSGCGVYKYSPFTLFIFIPFTLFSYQVAALIQFVIQAFAVWYSFILIRRVILGYMIREDFRHDILLLSVSFACILIQFARETYLGNINLILLMLSCRTILDLLEGKDRRGGILLGIAVLFKPYLILLALPLALRWKWRALASMFATGAAGLILPFIYPGPRAGFALYRDWMTTIMGHGGGFPGRTSIDYFIGHYVPGWPAWSGPAIIILAVILGAWLILLNIRREKENPQRIAHDRAFEWFLLLGIIPNLIRTDWVVMLLAAPVIAYIVFSMATKRWAKKWFLLIPVLIVIIFFYGANSDDLLGRQLSHEILEAGLMGAANLLLVLMSMFLFYRNTREKLSD